MNSIVSSQPTRIFYIPSYYENHFDLVFDRLMNHNKNTEFQIFTLTNKYTTKDFNLLLIMCRILVNEENIQMVFTDSRIGQLVVAKLCQEYPRIHKVGMSFLHTLQCLNRFLMLDVFGINECIPTLLVDTTVDWKANLKTIEMFLSYHNSDGYMKSLYGVDDQLSSVRVSNFKKDLETMNVYIELYKEQHQTNLLPLFRVYVPIETYSSIFLPSYIIQPFYDIVTYPHWRHVIANACIFNKEIIMWPLVDAYSGWPFLAEKPLAILPIIVCPSRLISSEQQHIVYSRFRQHLIHLITNYNLYDGWIECSYFISCTNEIRLISIKPTCSIYLNEAFNTISQYGNPLRALKHLSNHQRPQTPILKGNTVYIHRLWMNVQDEVRLGDVIHLREIKRIHRLNNYENRYAQLRFHEEHIVTKPNKGDFIEIGFIQVGGEYHEIGLMNLIEFRYALLKKPELFPFTHQSMLSKKLDQFNPITCLPSDELLEQLEKIQKQQQKDLI